MKQQTEAGRDGTVKAYLSDGAERSRQNAGGLLPDWAREARESERAAAELAGILAQTEPYEPLSQYNKWAAQPALKRALAESLATFTADGGPLDSLALDSAMAAGELLTLSRNMYHFNSVTIGPDPVILAAQRDLAVVRAYAATVGA